MFFHGSLPPYWKYERKSQELYAKFSTRQVSLGYAWKSEENKTNKPKEEAL
jgi:hypothetical protein